MPICTPGSPIVAANSCRAPPLIDDHEFAADGLAARESRIGVGERI